MTIDEYVVLDFILFTFHFLMSSITLSNLIKVMTIFILTVLITI